MRHRRAKWRPPAKMPCSFTRANGLRCKLEARTFRYVADPKSGVFKRRGRCALHPWPAPSVPALKEGELCETPKG